jgi:hypothetical protein
LDELEIFDQDGNVDGFEFDSKERRIQEWRDKKEEREFAALVQRLQKRNAANRARADESKRARILESERRHRASGKKELRKKQRIREKYAANPVVNVCEECSKSVVVPFEKRGQRKSRFCSLKCRRRLEGRERSFRRKKGLRDMAVTDRILSFLAKVGSATSAEVADATQSKITSVRQILWRFSNEGKVCKSGRRSKFRFSLAVIASETSEVVE